MQALLLSLPLFFFFNLHDFLLSLPCRLPRWLSPRFLPGSVDRSCPSNTSPCVPAVMLSLRCHPSPALNPCWLPSAPCSSFPGRSRLPSQTRRGHRGARALPLPLPCPCGLCWGLGTASIPQGRAGCDTAAAQSHTSLSGWVRRGASPT